MESFWFLHCVPLANYCDSDLQKTIFWLDVTLEYRFAFFFQSLDYIFYILALIRSVYVFHFVEQRDLDSVL